MTDTNQDRPSIASGGMLPGSTDCWKCGQPRDLYGDGSRSCSNCGAGELGWTDSW